MNSEAHVDGTMLVSLNREHRYPARISTRKIYRDAFPFTELLSVSRKSSVLEQCIICCRRLLTVRSKYFSSSPDQIHLPCKTF